MSDYYYHHYTYHLEIKMEIALQKDEEIVECPNCKAHLRITPTAYICPKCFWDVKHNVPVIDERLETRRNESPILKQLNNPESTDIRKDVVKCSCGLTFLGSWFDYKCPKCARQH